MAVKNSFGGISFIEWDEPIRVREDSDYLPHNYIINTVVYTSTHDNDTTAGWFKTT